MALYSKLLDSVEHDPDDPRKHLLVLRRIVAKRIDATDSARETASLARVMLDIERDIAALNVAPEIDEVSQLRARREQRGAQ